MPSQTPRKRTLLPPRDQPQITSFFNRTTTASSPSSPPHSPAPKLAPKLPATVQSGLINVGMRVRKAVPEGYKSGSYMLNKPVNAMPVVNDELLFNSSQESNASIDSVDSDPGFARKRGFEDEDDVADTVRHGDSLGGRFGEDKEVLGDARLRLKLKRAGLLGKKRGFHKVVDRNTAAGRGRRGEMGDVDMLDQHQEHEEGDFGEAGFLRPVGEVEGMER